MWKKKLLDFSVLNIVTCIAESSVNFSASDQNRMKDYRFLSFKSYLRRFSSENLLQSSEWFLNFITSRILNGLIKIQTHLKLCLSNLRLSNLRLSNLIQFTGNLILNQFNYIFSLQQLQSSFPYSWKSVFFL